jgi:hypothetical protein
MKHEKLLSVHIRFKKSASIPMILFYNIRAIDGHGAVLDLLPKQSKGRN